MHKPVLLNEVLKYLAPKDGEVYVDATFGAGGYSCEILKAAKCTVYAIDRDLNAIKIADEVKKEFGERFHFLRGNFSQVVDLLASKNVDKIDGIVFDLGVSSMQFDQKERGFSFDSDARLDMRMNQESHLSAYEVVNDFEEAELAKIIRDFGDERQAKRIAKKITDARRSKPVTSCRELSDIVRSCFGGKYFKINPATRSFQAIRIFVNQELEEISVALQEVKKIMKKDARLVVVSFHSLEDEIVKAFLKKEAGIEKTFSRYQPEVENKFEASFEIVNKSAIKPSEEEIEENIRARSSKMRVGIKL
jgi:16S rRNA (cytosine1402-N4)-methyltransferase